MGDKSTIEWTQATWNPVTGCTKISAGCANCYAERMARRLKAMGQPNYRDGFAVRTHEHMLELPLTWRQPREVFVNSMSDLFHEAVPFEFIARVFDVMRAAHQHTFQVLTKRSARLRDLAAFLDWPDNVWMGVSVEHARTMSRVTDLCVADGPVVRFLSCEPLLGPLPRLDLTEIDWVIVGGESGPRARRMEEEWVLPIRDACLGAAVPFFFKQWGGTRKKRAGRLLHGEEWLQWPESSVRRQREFELEAAV
jgi:protein gp37